MIWETCSAILPNVETLRNMYFVELGHMNSLTAVIVADFQQTVLQHDLSFKSACFSISLLPQLMLKMKNTSQYYTRTAQVLHWLMAIIFILAWGIGFYSGNFLSYDVDGSFKGQVITLHKNIATVILFLVVVRIFWRYTHPTPELPDSMSPAMKTTAHLGHLALYFMLLAMPITGCLYSWSAGHPAPVLYLFEIPRLVQENPDLVAIVKPLHIYLSWGVGLLIIGHTAAALKHHFIDKDNVLNSMLKRDK